jgi:hypothetical protein
MRTGSVPVVGGRVSGWRLPKRSGGAAGRKQAGPQRPVPGVLALELVQLNDKAWSPP